MSSERFRERLLGGEQMASNATQSDWPQPQAPGFGVVDDMSSEGFRARLRAVERQAPASGAPFVEMPAQQPMRPAAPAPAAAPSAAPSAAPAARPLRAAYSDVALPRSARWRPRNWRLRTKLTALTVIPLLLALALAAIRLHDVSRRSHSAALRESIVIGAVGLLALILLAVLARSILKPLRTLRASAFDVADRRLPAVIEVLRTSDGRAPDLVQVDPVPIYTREDVGQVARAFDAVHSEAVRLAAEQAALRATVNDMFVNLSRRSQSLVERQLRMIDELERGEQDAERLAAFFRLDHLATRMRRNSENLLVLAGSELRQRSGAPVPIVDVLRAAVSEIEDYRRVAIEPLPQAGVSGRAVNDIVHLVAELLDNATAYSNPESEVKLSARFAGQVGLTIEIGDAGAGIPLGRLAAINERLADPPAIDAGVSRQMGLFVVGRLAKRHGITVQLSSAGEGSGVTVSVTLPRELLISQLPAAPAESDEPTSRPDIPLSQPMNWASSAIAQAPGVPPAADTAVPAVAGQLLHADAVSQHDTAHHDELLNDLPAVGDNAGDTPIFQAMLSRWFQEREEAPTATGDVVAAVPAPESSPLAGWESKADEGWQAAAAINQPIAHELTAAGLPRRRPQAFLVPGGIDSTVSASEQPAAPAPRNAEAIRGRMSSYQRGLDPRAAQQAHDAGRRRRQ